MMITSMLNRFSPLQGIAGSDKNMCPCAMGMVARVIRL